MRTAAARVVNAGIEAVEVLLVPQFIVIIIYTRQLQQYYYRNNMYNGMLLGFRVI